VLVELIEIEKTFELFFANDCSYIRQIIQLAIDPSNEFNQKYLLQVLIQIVKNLKPQNINIFKDLDEVEEDKKRLDPDSATGRMISMFMSLV